MVVVAVQLPAHAAPPQDADRAGVSDAAQQRSSPARLSELAALALAVQPLLRSAEARERADGERVEQARGALRPGVSATGAVRQEFADSGATAPFSSFGAGVRFALPLYRPQADAGIDQALQQRNTSSYARAETQRDLLVRLTETYLAAVQADAEAALLEAERNLLQQQRVLNERRMAGGVGTLVEVMETAARADALLAQVQGARGQLAIQLAELSRFAATRISRVGRIRESAPPMVVPERLETALAQARERNATLARLAAALALARATLDVQRAGVRPTVDLIGNYDQTRAYFSGTPLSTPSAGVGVQLAVPLWTGGIVEARIREAHALVDKAEADLRDAQWVLEAELRKAYLDLERGLQQLRTQLGALEIAGSAFEATRKAFDAGVRSNIDLLNSQQLTFSARREVLRARVAIQNAQLRILALGDTLDVASLTRLEAAFTD